MTFEKMEIESKKDEMLELCKQQKYVPESCVLLGSVVYAFVNAGKDAYEGCNIDRAKCGGR